MYIYIYHIFIYIYIHTYMDQHSYDHILSGQPYMTNPQKKKPNPMKNHGIAGFAWIKQSRPQVIYRNHYYRNGKSSRSQIPRCFTQILQGVKHPLMTHPPKSHVERAPWNDQWLVSCARSPTSNNFFQAMSRPTRSKYMAQIPKGSLVKGPYKQGLCHLLFHYCK